MENITGKFVWHDNHLTPEKKNEQNKKKENGQKCNEKSRVKTNVV